VNPSHLSTIEPITRYDTHRSARAANSLLSTKYPDEQVILIPPNPDLGGMTLGNLKNIGGPAIARLASHQGLTPSEGQPDSEMARVNNLNMVLKHLGVSCARLYPFALKLELTGGEPGSRYSTRPFHRGTGSSSPQFRGRNIFSGPPRGSTIHISCVPYQFCVLERCPVVPSHIRVGPPTRSGSR